MLNRVVLSQHLVILTSGQGISKGGMKDHSMTLRPFHTSDKIVYSLQLPVA
jgi:hypothetical protein